MRVGFAIFIALWLALLAGCGFQLQPRTELPQEMERSRLVIQNPYSPFARQLRVMLEQGGVKFVEDESATAVLEVPLNEVRKEILTIGDNARVREYRVRHTVSFRLLDAGGTVLVPEQAFEQSRVISFDEQDILGAAQEEEFLRKDLAGNLARLLIRRLGTRVD